MKITASDVKKLRDETGSGMMDCKKALQEANGDFSAAVDILRKKGQKVAAKRGDRDAAEGLVITKISDDSKTGIIIVLNCETDFVAKNDTFVTFANTIADVALSSGVKSLDEVKALNFPGSESSIGDRIIEEIGKIGEKIDLSSFERVEAATVFGYNHPGNSLAALVGYSTPASDELVKDVAMQVAAMAPIALDKESIPQDVIDKELEIGKDLAIQEGKPAELAEKISFGRLNKFFKENTLLEQSYIKDNKISIKQFMKNENPDLTVTKFFRFSLN